MNVLALLAHPDDELMCAGTLARLVDDGHRVRLHTVFMDDRYAEWDACTDVLGVIASIEVEAVGDSNKVAPPVEDDFCWSRRWILKMDEHPALDLLISHRAEDPNTSHGHLGRIARTLARKNRCSLWELDQTMPGGIDPDSPGPNHFVDITSQITRKRSAVAAYKSQLLRYPGWAEAIEARDRMYGWQLHMTEEPRFAEAFRIVKSVWL